MIFCLTHISCLSFDKLGIHPRQIWKFTPFTYNFLISVPTHHPIFWFWMTHRISCSMLDCQGQSERRNFLSIGKIAETKTWSLMRKYVGIVAILGFLFCDFISSVGEPLGQLQTMPWWWIIVQNLGFWFVLFCESQVNWLLYLFYQLHNCLGFWPFLTFSTRSKFMLSCHI